MSDVVIKVENLSKKYIISHKGQEKYTALRDVLANCAKRLGKNLISPFTFHSSQPLNLQEDFYALKDISFEIKQGDRVGIIGRNGAGKSTLLKILSRITEPTSGRVEITGRVSSLLEVGTGFHPELTGRENIFLNGAILGMGKAEIKRKFDEIVDFAEVEKFLDTPVKRYSSGMYVRLAFAVAAHLEPEILIVDEVLAVGDAQFQKKCLGKMEEVGREGRTVLFVSHNLVAVEGLCTRALVLESGETIFDGNVREGLIVYNTNLGSLISEDLSLRNDRSGSGLLRFSGYSLFNEEGQPVDCATSGKCLIMKIRYEAFEEFSSVNVAFNLYEKENDVLINFNLLDVREVFSKLEKKGEFVCRIPYFPLREGLYYGNLHCTVNGVLADWVRPGIKIKVVDSDAHGTGRLVAQGKFVTTYDWGIA